MGALLHGAWLTLEISFLGIALGLGISSLLATVSCRQLQFSYLARVIYAYVALIRGIPLFIQLLLVYFALPELIGMNISPFVAGVVTLGINSAAYLTETLRAGIDGLPKGQWEAAFALGYTRWQTLRWIILPQAVAKVLPALANELCALIKDSSILMVIGFPELTKVAKDLVTYSLKPVEIYSAAALFYFAMTSSVGWIAKKIEGVWHVAHAH